MEIKRFFVDSPLTVGKDTVVTGDEFVHAVKVSRYKVGYKLILSNGDGYDYFAVITAVDKHSFTARVENAEKNANELNVPLVLYMCGIERSDIAVQKATEIGATEIRFIVSRFTNTKMQNYDRLRKIAAESAKQCGRAVVPKIFETVPFEEGVRDVVTRCDTCIFAYEGATAGRISDHITKETSSVAVIIGSEGGFAEEEVAFAREQGAHVVTLGRRILRAETASIVALALTADLLEKYESGSIEPRM
ncbi:MAG: 16S rRNA (uracil(1498)-N(3))-methyltransferase [Clostridia bacterium]|nr:16S rRNA (uracil(1498)-N(3))-methyltransferase [Clostridia bacterium]